MDIRLPSLGEGADSGTVVNILVKEGDQVQKDQPILELETEKAVGTIPSSAAGTIQKIRVKVGDKISAGQVILTLDGGPAPEEPTAVPATAPREVTRPTTAPVAAKTIPGIPPPASPSVRKLAAQLGIDLTRVCGSAHGGRITLEDVRAYIEQLQAGGHAKVAKPIERVDFALWGPVTKKPLSSLRKTIARRMGESWSAVPRVTQFDEADITALNELRKKHAGAYEAKGAKLTLTPLAMKAVVATLKKYPIFNSSLDEVTDEIVLKEYYHVGIAVDTEHGLLVPVIRDADKKSVLELSRELEELAANARDRNLSADQMKGGTFTISNQGGIGGGAFTPIVNKPEVAILGMGRGALKAVVSDGKIESRLMLPLALSYDHRVIDGGSAARFMVDLVAAFENFSEADVRI
ncbi:MAG TPA: 2-oxo acid dehydrogenase subunit E2 [Verrucomicrobiae bacterium]|nr:2-oxo acid dehydrogenase subunit E2 [Verrucomicrobiae bacterium]